MSASNVQIPALIIPNGAQVSNILTSPECFDDAEAIALYGLLTTDGALTYTLEATWDTDPTAASTFYTLQIGDPAGDAVPPAQGKARVYYELACVMGFRIKASAPVTADRTWKASKSIYL